MRYYCVLICVVHTVLHLYAQQVPKARCIEYLNTYLQTDAQRVRNCVLIQSIQYEDTTPVSKFDTNFYFNSGFDSIFMGNGVLLWVNQDSVAFWHKKQSILIQDLKQNSQIRIKRANNVTQLQANVNTCQIQDGLLEIELIPTEDHPYSEQGIQTITYHLGGIGFKKLHVCEYIFGTEQESRIIQTELEISQGCQKFNQKALDITKTGIQNLTQHYELSK